RREGMGDLTWEAALKSASIDAIAISTENTDHARRVEEALSAGKHVLCDYPLAFGELKAQSLFELAARQERVLHVEHIGLLTQAHQQAKQEIQALGGLEGGSYVFQAGWNPKIADKSRTGLYSFLALPRLLQVADLFGPFQIIGWRYQESSDGFSL